jgi:hypothetical protein
MAPTFIRSEAEFRAAVLPGITTESLVLEFKETIDPRQPDVQKETCRDVAQFANTQGGCLLVGIEEGVDSTPGLKVAKAIKPLANVGGLKQWIEDAITNYLVPSTISHDITPITLRPEGTILAVNVPASLHLVSLWDRQQHTVEYLRRTSHGKAWMNPDEAERHLMNASRAAKLAIHAARHDAAKKDEVEFPGGLWYQLPSSPGRNQPWNPPAPVQFGKLDEYWFQIRVPTGKATETITLPYGVVEEAWASSTGRVAILLSVRLIFYWETDESIRRIIMEPLHTVHQ